MREEHTRESDEQMNAKKEHGEQDAGGTGKKDSKTRERGFLFSEGENKKEREPKVEWRRCALDSQIHVDQVSLGDHSSEAAILEDPGPVQAQSDEHVVNLCVGGG